MVNLPQEPIDTIVLTVNRSDDDNVMEFTVEVVGCIHGKLILRITSV